MCEREREGEGGRKRKTETSQVNVAKRENSHYICDDTCCSITDKERETDRPRDTEGQNVDLNVHPNCAHT